MDQVANNRRIAKNTLMLYIRTLLTMAIMLYTSRVMLKTLGVDDFGIYNLVGGVVVLFTFLTTIMSTATQRFLSFDLGKRDYRQLARTFSMSLNTHFIIVLCLIILSETVGLWFVNYKLDIPAERVEASRWVYQFSVLNCCLKTIRVPYNAIIIAFEEMSFFAYMGILEVVLGLAALFVLVFLSADKLILYAVLVCGVSLLILGVYKLYCNKKIPYTKYKFSYDVPLFKKIMTFSGWSLLGSSATIASQQGLNIILNIFFGVAVNAAMAIANQVGQGVYSLVASFQTAFNPQLVKLYAQDEKTQLINMVIRTSKFSFYLLFLLALPLLLNTDYILKVWLQDVPPYTREFCRLMILYFCIDSFSASLWLSVQATGEIRNYEILISLLVISVLPFTYIVLKVGFPPASALVIKVLVNFFVHLARIWYMNKYLQLPLKRYLYNTMLLPALVILVSIPIPYLITKYISDGAGLILSALFSTLIIGGAAFFIGLSSEERSFIKSYILSKIPGRG